MIRDHRCIIALSPVDRPVFGRDDSMILHIFMIVALHTHPPYAIVMLMFIHPIPSFALSLPLFLGGLINTMPAAPTPFPDDAEALHALFADFDQWQRDQFPDLAMSRGDYSHADRITDESMVAIERRHQDQINFLERLHAIKPTSLNETDRVSYEIFDLLRSQSITGHRFRAFLAPIGGRFGPHQSIPQMADRVRFDSVEDYKNYLTRLEFVPRWCDQIIERLRLGVKENRTPPRITLVGLADQFTALLDPDGTGLQALAQPFANFPQFFSEEDATRLANRFRERSLPAVQAGLLNLSEVINNEYLPHCRSSIAAIDWPDGEAYYNHQLKVMTTTDLTAEEIHKIGLSEVARIRAEMMTVIRQSDFLERKPEATSYNDSALFAAFIHDLRTNPRFYYTNPDDLLMGYRNICKKVDGQMPALFKTLPRLPYGVKPIPEFMAPNQTTAYYQGGNLENAQAGNFYANTYALDQRPKYEMTALALHESVPGHHHQISIANELEGLPEFRQHTYFNAFGEGWALYAERLGLEMGLYDDPYDNFGRLTYEMWRACRLVVDPGMHALGWSRERAIQFMKDNSALTELNITTEIDRYIAWPGQACGYKIGELAIRKLRTRAERELGANFDLRQFHDVILTEGSLPLSILERRVKDWIRKNAIPRAYD